MAYPVSAFDADGPCNGEVVLVGAFRVLFAGWLCLNKFATTVNMGLLAAKRLVCIMIAVSVPFFPLIGLHSVPFSLVLILNLS